MALRPHPNKRKSPYLPSRGGPLSPRGVDSRFFAGMTGIVVIFDESAVSSRGTQPFCLFCSVCDGRLEAGAAVNRDADEWIISAVGSGIGRKYKNSEAA